jgi:hypothetical protein
MSLGDLLGRRGLRTERRSHAREREEAGEQRACREGAA